ncbi:unnamed protein product [Leptidea sinapis]|uniref:Uncharacterized protein n=1 Tax=Leptidea sinapis TaxID=189913 RepID=A0A5E4QNL0_9NEOP|nr:unnamed protein product [Leptidea sinapis]
MGFLISKTDQACKTFARVTTKAYRDCTLNRKRWTRYTLTEFVYAQERVLSLRYETELLIDLIYLNHNNLEDLLKANIRTTDKPKFYISVEH